MNNQYYRLGNDSQYSSLNRSTPMATIRNDQRNQFSANTNNINEESDNYDLKYVFGYLNGEKIECLLDTDIVKTLISQKIWRKLGCKELQKTKSSFTTSNGQPLNVIGFYTASLRIGFQTTDINPQLHDKEIVTVLGWKDASENRPHNESLSGDLRTYWLQWDRLRVINGVLYRIWKICDNQLRNEEDLGRSVTPVSIQVEDSHQEKNGNGHGLATCKDLRKPGQIETLRGNNRANCALIGLPEKTCENCGEEIKKIEETQHLLACRPAVVPIFSCPLCKTGLTEDEFAQHVVECMVPRENCRLCKGVIGHNYKCMSCPVCTTISNVEDCLIFSNFAQMLCGDDKCSRNYIAHFSTREGRLDALGSKLDGNEEVRNRVVWIEEKK
ncbi:hypothetical protein BpHYR1_001311 [Brachionus plicatilis]|uniref:Uncharacterized protein n=1 Tax=Brachionus plicatilis TaxID=10195 RepID=A0A3M7T7C1_BRAPC|nr:hypothetical protein BpHYR1_001311 [Brachionus plicatilis]